LKTAKVNSSAVCGKAWSRKSVGILNPVTERF